MKIVVFIKRVPDTEARLRIGGDGASVDASGVKQVISPYDEFALELALRLKEGTGGEVVAVSLGGASAEQLRSALAMGADRAVHLKGEAGMDGGATAAALAAGADAEGADLYLFGMKAVDVDQQQVGVVFAERMGLPCVTVVAELEHRDGALIAHREVEGGTELVEARLPAVVTVTKGAHEPRYPSLKGIMAAKRKPLEEKDVEVSSDRIRLHGLAYPPERADGRIIGEGADAVPELVRLLREEAKVL